MGDRLKHLKEGRYHKFFPEFLDIHLWKTNKNLILMQIYIPTAFTCVSNDWSHTSVDPNALI